MAINYILVPTESLVGFAQFAQCKRLKDGRTIIPMSQIKLMQGIHAKMEIVDAKSLRAMQEED